MKLFAMTLALAGGVVATAGAQAPPRGTVYQPPQSTCSYRRTTNTVGDVIFGRTTNTSNCQDVYSREDGAWYQVGRGRNNNSIYERRIVDSRGNLIIQRARRNRDGTLTIFSTRTAKSSDKQWRKAERAQDCTYSRTNGSVGDIIFGRSGNNTTNCVDNPNNRVNGAWYPVGRDGNGGTIYERQTRDSNGNLIIQRARRDSNGRLSVISTRNAGRNGTYNNTVYNDRSANARQYEGKKANGRGDADDDQDSGHGRGNGKGKGHDKGHERD